MKLKKYTALTLCAFALGGPITASANEFDQKIQAQDQKISQLEQTESSVISQKQALETEVTTIEETVAQTLKEKAAEEKKLSELTAKITTLQKNITQRERQLKKQARDVQTNHRSIALVNAVIDSESIGEIVKKTMAITTMLKASQETLDQQTRDKEELQHLEAQAKEHLAMINQKTTELKEKQATLIKAKLDQQVKLNELQASIATEKGEKEKFQQQKAEAEKKREAALKALAEQQQKEAEARKKAQEQAEQQAKLAAEQAQQVAQQAAKEQAAAQEQAKTAETEKQQAAAREAKIAAEEQLQKAEEQAKQAKLQEQQAASVTDSTAVQMPSATVASTESVVEETPTDTASTESADEPTENTETPAQPEIQQPAPVEPETPAQPSTPATNSSGWSSPLSIGLIVTSPFGWRENPTMPGGQEHHDGIDFAGAAGTPIHAAKAGTVVTASFHYSAGNHVIIQHPDGHYSYYMHLISQPNVAVGQQVAAGDVIGAMGTTGNSTGVHLHFGVSTAMWSGFVDPAPLLGI